MFVLILRLGVAQTVHRPEDVRTKHLIHLALSGLGSDDLTAIFGEECSTQIAIGEVVVSDTEMDDHLFRTLVGMVIISALVRTNILVARLVKLVSGVHL